MTTFDLGLWNISNLTFPTAEVGLGAPAEEPLSFYDFGDGSRDEFFPGSIAGFDLIQHVTGADPQKICVHIGKTLYQPVFDQVRVKMPQVGRDAIVFHRDDLAGLEIKAGINVSWSGA